eukprot:scaffold474022_cov14-Prasinocladus_malaysianus.AAC.1
MNERPGWGLRPVVSNAATSFTSYSSRSRSTSSRAISAARASSTKNPRSRTQYQNLSTPVPARRNARSPRRCLWDLPSGRSPGPDFPSALRNRPRSPGPRCAATLAKAAPGRSIRWSFWEPMSFWMEDSGELVAIVRE